MRTNRPPSVGDIVAGAGNREGIECGWYGHKHCVGIRYPHLVADDAAPRTHCLAKAVRCDRGLAGVRALRRQAVIAVETIATGYGPRHDHLIALRDAPDVFSTLQYFGHTFVPKGKRSFERIFA